MPGTLFLVLSAIGGSSYGPLGMVRSQREVPGPGSPYSPERVEEAFCALRVPEVRLS